MYPVLNNDGFTLRMVSHIQTKLYIAPVQWQTRNQFFSPVCIHIYIYIRVDYSKLGRIRLKTWAPNRNETETETEMQNYSEYGKIA